MKKIKHFLFNNQKLFYYSIFFVFSFFISESKGQSAEYPGLNVCYTRVTSKDINYLGKYLNGYEFLKHQLMYKNNCTHIQGNLIISDLAPNDQGIDPDLSFINSIKEISGFLFIQNVTVSKLEFPNLWLIRGQEFISIDKYDKLSLVVIKNQWNKLNNHVLKILSMPQLRTISQGNVLSMENSGLCFFPQEIQWQYMFDKTNESKLFHPQKKREWCEREEKNPIQCHPHCRLFPNKKAGCFSNREIDCQVSNRCFNKTCTGDNLCFISNGREECCHDLCSVGCTVGAYKDPTTCYTCKYQQNGNTCVKSCPGPEIYDGKRMVPNPDFKYQMGPYCARECPTPFVIQNISCLINCPNESPLSINGTCKACLNENCPKNCDLYEIGTRLNINYMTLDSRILKELVNCTHLRGDLLINEDTFNTNNLQGALAVQSVDEFYSLSSLREISGRLQINSNFNMNFFKNLTFLKNLEKIGGESYAISHITNYQRQYSVIIQDSNLEFLGLQKLKIITGNVNVVYLQNLSNICFIPEVFLLQSLSLQMLQREYVQSADKCREEKKICHKSCLDCWGPGRDMCINCRKFQVNDKCADDCREIPGYFYNYQTSNCDKCHEECAETCSGKNSSQCIGKCKNAKENGACVNECSVTHYLNSTSGDCLPCNKVCTAPFGERVCDGPGNRPGPGGCNRCLRIELTGKNNNEFGRCESQTCPKGTHQDQENVTKESMKYVINSTKEWFLVCRPCPPLCTSCVGQDLTKNTCNNCTGVWFQEVYGLKCRDNCPTDEYYHDNSTRVCLNCHTECYKGCFGPTNSTCNSCRNRRVFVNSSSSFYCTDKCPPDVPHEDFVNGLNICITDKEKKEKDSQQRILIAVPTSVGIILFIILLIGIIWICLSRIKAQNKKIFNRLKIELSDKNAPDFKNTIIETNAELYSILQENKHRLIVIRCKDVQYENKSRPLSRSTSAQQVYKGYWNIPNEETKKLIKKRGRVKMPVAITEVKIDNGCASGSGSGGGNGGGSGSGNDTNTDEGNIFSKIHMIASIEHKHCLRVFGFYQIQDCFSSFSIFHEQGNMNHYLRQHVGELTSFTLLLWASQIADAMAYLQMIGIVHRNLAARNVLIVDENMIQITDIAQHKSIIHQNHKDNIPWLALETLINGEYSHATDIWSFGVTLWEIFSFGARPYQVDETVDIKDHIIKGGRLSQPTICTLDVYMVLVKCWMEDPASRPPFNELLSTFETFVKNPGRYLCIENDPTSLNRNNKPYETIEMMERPLLSDYNSRITSLDGQDSSRLQMLDDGQYLIASDNGTLTPPQINYTEPLLPHKNESNHHHPLHGWKPNFGGLRNSSHALAGLGNNNNNNTPPTTTTGRPMTQKFLPSPQSEYVQSSQTMDDNYVPSILGIAPTPNQSLYLSPQTTTTTAKPISYVELKSIDENDSNASHGDNPIVMRQPNKPTASGNNNNENNQYLMASSFVSPDHHSQNSNYIDPLA